MSKQKIIDEIRQIVGNKKFTFSEAYIKQCGCWPTIGENDREFGSITRKYVTCRCYAIYCYDKERDDYGYKINRFPVCGCHKEYIKDRLELEDLFTADLQKILDEIKYYLWWEANVRLPRISADFNEAMKYAKLYKERVLRE